MTKKKPAQDLLKTLNESELNTQQRMDADTHQEASPADQAVAADAESGLGSRPTIASTSPVEHKDRDLSGEVIGGYELLEKLGAGGGGDVYEVRHTIMHRTDAMKILKPEITNSSEAVQRFLREVKTSAQLSHENIVKIFTAGEDQGLYYYVMELVSVRLDGQANRRGASLGSIVDEAGAIAVPAAVNYVRQAANGLAYAHAQGVVHRDVKPDNLLLNHAGVVKVTDMGLAILHDTEQSMGVQTRLTQDNTLRGTVAFISPEQDHQYAGDRRTIGHL